MLAFEVKIDGEKIVIAGVEDWGILALHVNANRGDPNAPSESARIDHLEFSVGGLTEKNSSGEWFHFRWPRKEYQLALACWLLLLKLKMPILQSSAIVRMIKFKKIHLLMKKYEKCAGKHILNLRKSLSLKIRAKSVSS